MLLDYLRVCVCVCVYVSSVCVCRHMCIWLSVCARILVCVCVCQSVSVTWGHVSAFRLHLLSPPLLLLLLLFFFFFVGEERSVAPVRAASIHRLSHFLSPFPRSSASPSLLSPSSCSSASSSSLYLEHSFSPVSASGGCFTWRPLLSLNCHGSHLSNWEREERRGGE